MNPYRKYVITQSIYGILAVIGLLAAVFFSSRKDYFLALISLLFFYISLDNFFCSEHARKAGLKAAGHYSLPAFLRKDKQRFKR